MSFMAHTLDGRRDADRWDDPPLSSVKRKRFWCRQAGRDVEVRYQTRGLPGLRWITGVKSCTAFDPRSAVTCTRKCIDPDTRRAWDVPLSMLIRK
jgi:hypothetical protein